MKLFGNKRNSRRAAKRRHLLTGVQRGLLLLLGSLLVLGLTVFAVYRDFVKPPEDLNLQKDSENKPAIGEEDDFRPPTVIEIETTVDDDGNEIQVEVEVPASYKEGFYNILIAGTDADGTRTDTIMIARMDVSDHSIALLSTFRRICMHVWMNMIIDLFS